MTKDKIQLEKFRRPLLITAGVLLFYAVSGIFVVPALLQWKLPEMIRQETGRKAAIKEISFNPFAMDFSLQGFELQEKNGQPFATFGEFHADVAVLSSIGHFLLTFEEVRLSEPFLHIEKRQGGAFNFDDLAAGDGQEPSAEETGEIFPVKIGQLILAQGKVAWQDSSQNKPVTEEISPLDLKIVDFTTVVDEQSTLGFSAHLMSGGNIQWQGQVSVNPLFSKGHVRMENIDTHHLWQLFLQQTGRFELKRGQKLVDFDYLFRFRDDKPDLQLRNGSFLLKNFTLMKKGGNRPVIDLASLAVQGIAFDLLEQRVGIASITSSGGRLITWLNKAGEINYRELFATEAEPSSVSRQRQAPSAKNAAAGSWKVAVDAIALHDYAVTFREQGKMQPVVQIPDLTVHRMNFDAGRQRLDIASLALQRGVFDVWLDAHGVLNYQTIFAANTAGNPEQQIPAGTDQSAATTNTAAGKKAEVGSASPFRVGVGKISLQSLAVGFADKTLSKPFSVQLAPLNLQLTGFSTDPGAKLPLQFSTGVDKQGKIAVQGELVIEPLSADLQLQVEQVALQPLQPYVEKFTRLDIIAGDFNTQGSLSLGMTENDALDVVFQGDANVARLHTRDQLRNRDFLKWRDLQLKKIDFNLQPIRFTTKEILLLDPYARVVIKKDGSMNFDDVLIGDSGGTVAAGKPVQASVTDDRESSPPYYKIEKFKVVGGASDFSDYSLILPFVAKIDKLDGELQGLSSEKQAIASLTLHGEAFQLSPVDIIGRFSPASGDGEVKLDFQSMPLPLVSPYMADFAGYKIEKGKMSVQLQYKVAKGQLQAENNLVIDQLTLGEKVENPDAVSLPLELAIAMLKDSIGRIELNLPVSGNVDNPDFSIGSLLFDAFVNVLTKIATSPFTAIAALVGTDEDLSYVSFAAGSSELQQQQIEKLDVLAKALRDRPELRVAIKGEAYQEEDWPAIREQALYDHLKALHAEELKKEGKKIRPEYVVLSEDEYKQLLAEQFIKKYPHLAEWSIFGNPKLKNPDAGDFYQVARRTLAASIPPDRQRLNALARDRARAIARHLVDQGIPNDRVFVLDTKVVTQPAENGLRSELMLQAS